MTDLAVEIWADSIEGLSFALADYPGPGPWAARGACLSHPSWVFFPVARDELRQAQAICAACPVQLDCLEYALTVPRLEGVWGGTSTGERRRLRATMPAPATSTEPAPADGPLPRPQSSAGSLYRTLLDLVRGHQPGTWAQVATYAGADTAAAMASNCRGHHVTVPPGVWQFEAHDGDAGGSELYACFLGRSGTGRGDDGERLVAAS